MQFKNPSKKTRKEILAEILTRMLGQTFANYVFYEAKLLKGLLLFLKSPRKNYRAVMSSYFATEKLKAIFIAIPCLMFLETGLIHILVLELVKGTAAVILHAFIIISEFYVCEILLGNLYYLQFSKVTIDDELRFKMGIMWDFSVPLTAIDRIEPSNRVPGDKTPKISLLQADLVRVHFKSKVQAIKHFRRISFDQADIFLQESDWERLRAQSSMTVQTSLG